VTTTTDTEIPPLRVGDVIEVATDFDSCVVSPGDRVIHLGKKRWYFTTRFPTHGLAPLYDCSTALIEDGFLKVVDHLVTVPTDPDELAHHPILRRERGERFLDSLVRHAPAVREVWQLDLRCKAAKEKLDDLVVAILRDEPDLLWDVDIAHHFFYNHLTDPERWWRGTRKLSNSIGRALESSVKRLESRPHPPTLWHPPIPSRRPETPNSMITFETCIRLCLKNEGFLREFDSLMGCRLASERTPIETLVDKATGVKEAELEKLIAFVYETVWLRLDPSLRAETVEPPPGKALRELLRKT